MIPFPGQFQYIIYNALYLLFVMSLEWNEKVLRKMCVEPFNPKRPAKSHRLNSKRNMKCHSNKHNFPVTEPLRRRKKNNNIIFGSIWLWAGILNIRSPFTRVLCCSINDFYPVLFPMYFLAHARYLPKSKIKQKSKETETCCKQYVF